MKQTKITSPPTAKLQILGWHYYHLDFYENLFLIHVFLVSYEMKLYILLRAADGDCTLFTGQAVQNSKTLKKNFEE